MACTNPHGQDLPLTPIQLPGPVTDFGLEAANKALLKAASDVGIKYIAGDMSFRSEQPSAFNGGIYIPLQPDLLLVPTWPTNIAFEATTQSEQVSWYDSEYGLHGSLQRGTKDFSYDEYLDAEAELALGEVIRGSAYSYTVHQTNLHQYAPGRSLLFDWLDVLVAKYSAFYRTPLKNPDWLTLAAYVEGRTAHFAALARQHDAVWDRVADAVSYTPGADTVLFATGLATRPATEADQDGPDQAGTIRLRHDFQARARCGPDRDLRDEQALVTAYGLATPAAVPAVRAARQAVVCRRRPTTRSLRVALIGEGTYPFSPGGVSLFCHQLIEGMREHSFTAVALTVDGTERLAWPALDNLAEVVNIPLWGARHRRHGRPRTPPPSFDAHYETLLRSMFQPLGRSYEMPCAEEFAQALRGLFEYAQEGDLSDALLRNDPLDRLRGIWHDAGMNCDRPGAVGPLPARRGGRHQPHRPPAATAVTSARASRCVSPDDERHERAGRAGEQMGVRHAARPLRARNLPSRAVPGPGR